MDGALAAVTGFDQTGIRASAPSVLGVFIEDGLSSGYQSTEDHIETIYSVAQDGGKAKVYVVLNVPDDAKKYEYIAVTLTAQAAEFGANYDAGAWSNILFDDNGNVSPETGIVFFR
ncbi:MAG: hypothetical protein ACI90U_001062 [Pseudomonadales bacterium]|jgi:hypothetical protein